MSFTDAVKTCLHKFLDFKGRAHRAEYWWFFLFTALVAIVAHIIDGLIFGFAVEDQIGKHPFTLISSFVLFFPMLAVGWRRMHDTGHPGLWILAPQLVIIGAMMLFLVTVGVFGLVGQAFDAPTHVMQNFNGITFVFISILLYGSIIAAALLKLWWLTRPGDEHTNEYGNPPA